MKKIFLALAFLLSACSAQNDELKNKWIANLTAKTLYGTGYTGPGLPAGPKEPLVIDRASGDFKVDGKQYKFNEVRSETTAVYTQNTGSYVGVILTADGLKTAKYTDAVSKPSQGKNNLDFGTPEYTVATYTK